MTVSFSSCEGSQEPTTPSRIGAGSFAAVYASPGRPIAIKVAHSPDDAAQVEWEFASLQAVLATTQNKPDALFMVPRPLAYYGPQTERLLFPPRPVLSSPNHQERTGIRRRLALHPRPFNPEFFTGLPPRPCYIMGRAAPLPPHVARSIRERFYPFVSNVQPEPPLPLICRLYFGKELELRPRAFVNPANFPLDAARYGLLRSEHDGIPSKEEVAQGMGEMLAVIHWEAGYDARDVEFVMTGAQDSVGVRFYVIDFNQVRRRR